MNGGAGMGREGEVEEEGDAGVSSAWAWHVPSSKH